MKCLTATIINNGPLTPKESVILLYLCQGYYRPEIALKLHRSLSTISKHVEHISEKLNAHGSTEIVVIAEKMGLVEINIIKPEHHPFLICVLVFLIVGQIFSPLGRRPPRPPSPTARHVRTQHQ